ncbi:hypothetical protein FRB99_000103 [Tulasnella sp. 403]|nr:hypothetical protein FRB99_000103 [Tulasnella sp. 403]
MEISTFAPDPPDELAPCPSPYDSSYDPPLAESSQQCSPIPSAQSEFFLSLCHDPQLCNAFTLRITRTSKEACLEAEASPDPSLDDNLNAWIREQRGPDGFMRFQAYSETNKTWPEMLLRPLFTAPLALSICPSHCVPIDPARVLPGDEIISYPYDSVPSPPMLPPCSGREPIRGSYHLFHLMDILYPPERLPSPQNLPVSGRYRFFPRGCQWEHYGQRFGYPAPCTEKQRRIAFYGDSHGRVIYDTTIHRLQGNRGVLEQSEKGGHKQATIGNLTFDFLWDPRGESVIPVTCKELKEAKTDIVILSMGAHFAVDSTTAEFTQNLTRIFTTFTACEFSPPPSNIIFVTSPAQPPRQDEFVRKYSDHRTNVRLQHWSEISTKMALDMGFSVVDQFALTMPHVWEPMGLDFAHYLSTDAIDPIVDEVIGKAGLCG